MRSSCLAVAMAILLGHTAVLLHADDLDDLIGNVDEGGLGGAMLLDDTMSQEEFEPRLAAALKQREAAVRRKQLTELLDVLSRSEDIVLLPRDWTAFAEAVLETVDPAELAAGARKLLQVPENIQFNLSAQSRLKLGLRFALAAGGVPFEQLKQLHDRYQHARILDMEWLLPALARAGGAEALPLIAPYRRDASIIRLNNGQNIRRVPCAAVLAAAYAGDTNALELVLTWYEEDTLNRPRFAFYVAWGIQEGMKPDYVLLDYCGHRIAQAERLLDFLGQGRIPDLIARANRDASISLTGYLSRKMEAASAEGLAPFLPFADHPCVLVKQRAMLTLLDRGDAGLRGAVTERLRALLTSQNGSDRFVAAETLALTEPAQRDALFDEAVSREDNPAARRRLVVLRDGGIW